MLLEFMYWNMVLPLPGTCRWGWAQNARFSTEPSTGRALRNPEFYAMRHVSGFVDHGAVRLEALDPGSRALAILNPNCSVVVVVGNDGDEAVDIDMAVDDDGWRLPLPARSLTTVVLA